MGMRITFLASAAAFCATPALGQQMTGHNVGRDFSPALHKDQAPTPRTIKAFSLAERSIEMRAITRRAHADTPLRRDQLEEAIEMAGVYPGYPQPAFVTVDFRVRF